MIRRAARLLPAAMLAGAVWAGTPGPYGAVVGTVRDGDARPVAGARTALIEPGSEARREVVTGVDGRFELPRVWPGAYRVEVDAAGHQWVEVRDLVVEPGRTVVLSIRTVATTADEVVLLTGAPTVDAAAVELALPAPPRDTTALPGGRWQRIPGAGADASDGATPEAVSLFGAPAAELARSLAGGPDPQRVRDVESGSPPGAVAATVLLGGLAAAGVDRLGGRLVMVADRQTTAHGAVGFEHLDDSFAGAGGRAPYGRAGWRGPASESALELTHGQVVADGAAWGFAAVRAGVDRERLLARPGGGRVATDDLVERRRLDWLAALDWSGGRHRLHLTASGYRQAVDDALTTVDRLSGPVDRATDTSWDADADSLAATGSWLAMASEGLLLDVRAGLARATGEFRPGGDRPAFVDATSGGELSGGAGGGVVLGGAGFARHADEMRTAFGRVEAVFDPGPAHRLEASLAMAVRRTERDVSAADPAARRCFPASHLPPGAGPECDSDGDGLADGIAVDWSGGTRVLATDDGWWITDPADGGPRGRGEEWTVALVDRWRPAPAWSVAAGIRAGWWTAEASLGGAVREVRFDPGETLGGFVGAAWDFEGRGRSRAYLQLGRTRRPLSLDPDAGLLVRSDPTVVRLADAGSGGGAVVDLIRPGPLVVDPGLEPGRVDEGIVGVEYEVLAGVLVGAAGIVRRLDRDPVAVTLDGGRSWWLTSSGATLWTDPATGAPLPEPATVAAPRRDLEAVTAYGHRRWAAGWQLDVWLAWMRVEGNVEGARLPGLRRFDPAVLLHPLVPAAGATGGPLANDRRWQGRMSGAATLGRGLTLSGAVGYLGGTPRSRVGGLAPPLGLDQRVIGARGGAGRTPGAWQLDLRLAWRPSSRERLELAVEVRNLLDDQAPIAADPRWTVAVSEDGTTPVEPRWGEPALRQRPRTASVGARWSW